MIYATWLWYKDNFIKNKLNKNMKLNYKKIQYLKVKLIFLKKQEKKLLTRVNSLTLWRWKQNYVNLVEKKTKNQFSINWMLKNEIKKK